MATPAQIDANRLNAQSSTGPRTPEGKLASAQNGIETGLFTTTCFVRPNEAAEYEEFASSYRAELVPVGILEQTLATEIMSAAWRLRRCNLVELSSELTEDLERSLHRSRANAHNIMRKAMAELRRLQTERQVRNEIYPEGTDLSDLGLASMKEVIAVRNNHERARLAAERVGNFDAPMSVIHKACSAPGPVQSASLCKTAGQTARNSLCPCKSGQKYKRCCGVNAPPLLGKAA